jgi:hypothetical protein
MDQGVAPGGHGLRLKWENAMRISVACLVFRSLGAGHMSTGRAQGCRRRFPTAVLR